MNWLSSAMNCASFDLTRFRFFSYMSILCLLITLQIGRIVWENGRLSV